MPDQIIVGEAADFEPPEEKKKYKQFEMIDLDSFQVIRMCLTPRCMYTYYQMTLERLLQKAEHKINSELEISTLMKRVRDTHHLVMSYE